VIDRPGAGDVQKASGWIHSGHGRSARRRQQRGVARAAAEVEHALRDLRGSPLDHDARRRRQLRRRVLVVAQVHRWNPWTDHDETLGALSDLVAQGKVRYIGSSTYPATQIVKAQWVARERGIQRFVCEQPPYSILARGIEADVLPTCQSSGSASSPGARWEVDDCRADGERRPRTLRPGARR